MAFKPPTGGQPGISDASGYDDQQSPAWDEASQRFVARTPLLKTGGTMTVEQTGPLHALNVTTKNPGFPSGRARFAIENNQDTATQDAWFHDVVLAIGHWDSSSSADAALALYQPAAPGTGNMLQVFKPGHQTQKVFYIGPQGDLHNVSVGLATKCFTIGADGAAEKVFEIHQTGEIRIGPGASTAPDVILARTAATTLTITGNLRIDGDVRMVKFAGNLGFFNGGGVGKQTITGSRAGNAALASLLTALHAYALISDSTTA